MSSKDVVIVGAGLAGLSCALRLARAGVNVRVLDAADEPGGRVRTDSVDGFLLDRGFQVLLTSYGEAQDVLDYDKLSLHCFRAGAIVRSDGAFHTIADPRREHGLAVQTATSPIGTWLDKLRIVRLQSRATRGLTENPVTSAEYLSACGFSQSMMRKFLRPFLAGIFLETRLFTTSLKLEFVFRSFGEGHAALPTHGMRAIPDQMVKKLPAGSVQCGVPVTGVREGRVVFKTGEEIDASYIVLAVPRPEAVRLAGGKVSGKACSTVCLYFDAPEPPLKGPWLILNGEGTGLVNNLCVPSEVCPSYAHPGRALVSVSIIGDPEHDDATLEFRVREELTVWFGPVVQAWRHLRTYRIRYALPMQGPADIDPREPPPHLSERVLVCGDYTQLASIDGALKSGRLAAETILASSQT